MKIVIAIATFATIIGASSNALAQGYYNPSESQQPYQQEHDQWGPNPWAGPQRYQEDQQRQQEQQQEDTQGTFTAQPRSLIDPYNPQ